MVELPTARGGKDPWWAPVAWVGDHFWIFVRSIMCTVILEKKGRKTIIVSLIILGKIHGFCGFCSVVLCKNHGKTTHDKTQERVISGLFAHLLLSSFCQVDFLAIAEEAVLMSRMAVDKAPTFLLRIGSISKMHVTTCVSWVNQKTPGNAGFRNMLSFHQTEFLITWYF